MIRLHPKDYSGKTYALKALEGHISDISGVDFDKMIDSSIDGNESFSRDADKAIKDPASKADNEVSGLWTELTNDLFSDFSETFENYIFLIENKLDGGEDFPFKQWQEAFDSLKDEPDLDAEEILNNIERIANIDKEIAISNLAGYLNVIQREYLTHSGLFPHLNMILNKHFPEAKLTSVLSCTNHAEFVNALKGQEFEVKEKSYLFFEYSAYLPLENWLIKRIASTYLNRIYKKPANNKEDPVSLGLNIPINIVDMNEVYSAFAKTEVWEKINSSDNFKKIFINNLVKMRNRIDNEYLIKNAEHFISGLSKDDITLAEMFFTALEKTTYGSQKEEAKIKFDNCLKMALKFILDKEMPQSDIKVKRNKI